LLSEFAVLTSATAGMPHAVAPLTDIGSWARSEGLQIVLLVVGAILLSRFVSWLTNRLTTRIDRDVRGRDSLVTSESAKHRHAVAQVVNWASIGLICCLTAMMIIQRLGIPLTGVVAPATLLGVALALGAQRMVQDLLAGFFIVLERQYGFGDLVRINATGVPVPITGTVEEVTLRVTQVRTLTGEVVITANGQIAQVTNLSRDWARAVVDVPVAAHVDVNHVTEILKRVGAELFADAHWHPLLLDTPSIMGVESMDVDTFNVRVVARTLPGKQFEVSRALRARITLAFAHDAVTLPGPIQDSVEPIEAGT